MSNQALAKKTRNAEVSREKLIQTAIALIWNNSYESVGVNEICKQAGLTKGAFYHHFPSKADLFYAASRRYSEDLKIRLDAIVSPTLNAMEQFQALCEFSVELQEKHSHSDNPVVGCPFFTTGAIIGHTEPLAAKAAQELTEEFLVYLTAIVRNLQDQGYTVQNHTPEKVARILYQYYHGLMLCGRAYQSYEIISQDEEIGFSIILGLKPEYRS